MTDKQIIIYKKECYNEPHCSLNQVLEQLNAYKMEADEGKEINAELKAENDELKVMFKDLSYENQKFCYQIEEQTKQLEPFKDEYFKGLETIVIAELAKKSIRITAENSKLEKILTEIKEIAENAYCLTNGTNKDMAQFAKQILQKISECEVE
jgi:FtsZ-binding cell division protein ZapB